MAVKADRDRICSSCPVQHVVERSLGTDVRLLKPVKTSNA